ncbi:MAG: acyltransferase [Gammaproteobacteria bacterium]|nr:acyltransferase [Gammaproteobacteria bacterium]
MSYFAHETACIDTGAVIGEDTSIWHFSHVCSEAKIGQNCTLGQNSYVGSKAVIGNNVKIQNNVSIYNGVVLENDVFCGPSVVFTNVYNPRAFIERKTEYKNTVIQQGASLGANCTIRCGVQIGSYAFIGAGAVILDDFPDYSLVVGNPGKQIGWISKYGERLALPLEGQGDAVCPHTGETYVLEGHTLNVKQKGD